MDQKPMKKPWEYYSVQCICPACGRPQSRKVNDLVAGAACCMGRIGAKCEGVPRLHSDNQEQAQWNANAVLGYLNETLFKNNGKGEWPQGCEHRLEELLDTAVDELNTWTPQETPQQMGWVGQNGLP